MHRAAIALALIVTGCAGTPRVVTPPLDPCPSAVSAPLEPEPQGPALTPLQQLAADAGLIRALGPDLAAAYTQYRDVDHPAWARRLAVRVAQGAAWCTARR